MHYIPALQQPEVIFLAGKEPPTAPSLRLCPKEEVIQTCLSSQSKTSLGAACQKQALSLPESGWSLESRWAGRLWGSGKKQGTYLAWELRRWTPSAAFSVAGLPAALTAVPST